MKYNRSKIMKNAWELFKLRTRKGFANTRKWTFGECLKEAWADAKEAATKAEKVNALGNYFTTQINFCEITINKCDNIISGNTFKIKNILKKYGFRWNSAEKYWESGDVSAFIEDVVAA